MARIGVAMIVVVIILFTVFFPQWRSSESSGVYNGTFVSEATRAEPEKLTSVPRSRATEADISFPDTDPIKIAWKRRPGSRYELKPADRGYESLRARAEAGDEIAAFYLSGMLDRCRDAFATEVEMEAAIDRLQQTQTIVYPNSNDVEVFADPERQIPVAIERIRKRFDTCYGISAELKSQSGDWLRKSASGGFSPAIMELAYQEENSETAIGLFKQAWNLGDQEALLGLSKVYFANYKSGVEPTDKVRAYAALYLYTRIVEAGMGPGTGHGEVAIREVARVQKGLDVATDDMLSHELDEAIEVAKSMIEANSNCCYDM